MYLYIHTYMYIYIYRGVSIYIYAINYVYIYIYMLCTYIIKYTFMEDLALAIRQATWVSCFANSEHRGPRCGVSCCPRRAADVEDVSSWRWLMMVGGFRTCKNRGFDWKSRGFPQKMAFLSDWPIENGDLPIENGVPHNVPPKENQRKTKGKALGKWWFHGILWDLA